MTSTRSSDNALVLLDGFVYVGPVGTTAPTNTTTALNAAFDEVGWLGESGFGETRSNNATEVYGVNGSLIRNVRTNDTRKFTFEALERNAIVNGLTRPGSTPATATGITTTPVKAFTGTDGRAWVLEEHFTAGDGTVVIRRVSIALGEAAVTGTITDNHSGLSVVQFEVTCFPSADGVLYTDITDNAAESVS